MKLNREKLRGYVRFSKEILPEDMPFEGAFASGDPDMDAQDEAWIREQLEGGNWAAWCVAHVYAEAFGLHVDSYLGGCNYESESQLWEQNQKEMESEAFEDLCRNIEELIAKVLT